MSTPTEGYTEIEYGSGTPIKITNCQTLKFHQETVIKALDQSFTRFTVRVSGYFLAQSAAASTSITPNMPATVQTAGTQLTLLREALMTPRKPFKMTMGTGGSNPTIVLQANPVGSDSENINNSFDVCGGPMPKSLSVNHIVGNTALKVEWECEVCLQWNCSEEDPYDPDIQKARGILSNKWTCTDDIDENFYLKSRVFVGEMKLANPLVNPHDFRQLVVPPISPGMRVKSMNFKASEDCLTLQYTVTHEEVTVTAPYPATSIKIQHKVHIAENELEVQETLSITLHGDRNVNKQDLILLAMKIADAKIRLKTLIPEDGIGKFHRLRHQEIVDESGTNQDNRIHAIFHMTHLQPKNPQADIPGEGNAFQAIRKGIGRHIDGTQLADYDNTLTRGNRAGESPEIAGPITTVGAFASHLQSTCTRDHSINAAIEGSDGIDTALIASITPEMELPSVGLDIYPDLDDLPDETWNPVYEDGIYQTYQVDSHYTEHPMIMQVPVSASTFDGTATAASSSYSAEDGDSSAFVRIGPSQWTRTVRILAQRHAAPPRLPEPLQSFRDDDGVLNVLKSKDFSLSEPQRSGGSDNIRDYIVRAEYVYGMSKAPTTVKAGIPDSDAPVDTYDSSSLYSFTLATLFSSDHDIG